MSLCRDSLSWREDPSDLPVPSREIFPSEVSILKSEVRIHEFHFLQ